MNKWHYENDQTCYCDGTGTYERGFYAVSRAGYECGAEPECGPFGTQQEAAAAAMQIDAEIQLTMLWRKQITNRAHKNESTGNSALIRKAMSLLGKAGRGSAKRRAVDYSALARKAHASRARNKAARG